MALLLSSFFHLVEGDICVRGGESFLIQLTVFEHFCEILVGHCLLLNLSMVSKIAESDELT